MKPKEYYLEFNTRVLRAAKVMQVPENPITVMFRIANQTGMDLTLEGLQKIFKKLDECIDREHRLREEDLIALGYDRDSVLMLTFIGAITEIRIDLNIKYPDVDTETEI